MGQESPLDLPLLRRLCHSQEIEVVGVFEDPLRHVRLWRRQLSREVGQWFFRSRAAYTRGKGRPACRSLAKRSLILLPHPSVVKRWLRSRPIDQ
jgi:hypothetical protein